MSKLGDQIRYYRSINNLTLKDIANKTDLSVSFVSEIERGRRNPSLGNLNKLAAALGVETAVLIGAIKPPLTAEDYAEGYAEESTPQDELLEGVEDLIRSLSQRSLSGRKFPPNIQQAVEREFKGIKDAYDVEFEYTPDDILQVCKEVDNAEFTMEFTNALKRVQSNANNAPVSTDPYDGLTEDEIAKVESYKAYLLSQRNKNENSAAGE